MKNNPELINAGRDWLLDCFEHVHCQETIAGLNDVEIIRAVNREWVGGWSAFKNNFNFSDK
jgi:hypothetical protein